MNNKGPQQHLKRRAYDNLIFGRQPIIELLKSDQQIEQILMQGGSTGDAIQEIRRIAKSGDIPIKTVPQEKLNRLTGGNHQGVIAFTSAIKFQQLDDIVLHVIEQGESPLILILDHITDIGNFGAICRTAWGAGVHAILIPTVGAAPVNADAVKTSAGALNEIPVCRVKNLAKAIDDLKMHGIRIIGANANSNVSASQEDMDLPLAIIMGSEDEGISYELEKLIDQHVKLPMARNFDSYNVSVACAMLLYEVMRQKIR